MRTGRNVFPLRNRTRAIEPVSGRLLSPLPALQEQVRVRFCRNRKVGVMRKRTLAPALSRSTGRGKSVARVLIAFIVVSACGRFAGADEKSITVAADGSADFKTVQGAIDSIPTKNAERRVILIKPGV